MGVPIGDIIPRKKIEIDYLNGRILAVDALNNIYQFLSSIRDRTGQPMKNSRGQITSHLIGLFYRNVNLLEHGLKLVYVFDGKPYKLKHRELEKRKLQKEEAYKKYQDFIKKGNIDEAKKFIKRYRL